MKWTWDHTWGTLLVATVTALISIGVTFVVVDKHVDGYYLSRGGNSTASGICVYAHWTWHYDEVAFCTDDYQKAVDFATKSTAALKGK